MKTFNKIFAFTLCCAFTMSVVSCINDDDNGSIDTELYKTYLNNISGIYYGSPSDARYANKIYFYNDTIKGSTTKEKTDSIEGITVAFAQDSTFAITGVPGRVLAKEIPDGYKDLKAAIENAPAQTLKGKFVFYSISQYAYFTVYPASVTYESLSYGGGTHNVSIAFWNTPTGLYGYVNNRQIAQASLYVAAVYIDGNKAIDLYDGRTDSMDKLRAELLVCATK